jgi:hypothetical protein
LEIREYIESGIIESYLLGLATHDEAVELQQLRRVFPELNSEIAMTERRLEKMAFADDLKPPAEVWNKITHRIRWEEENRHKSEEDRANYTFINMQPRTDHMITVHKNWKYAFIVIFILSKIFLIGAIILGLKYYREMRDHRVRQQSAPTQLERTK